MVILRNNKGRAQHSSSPEARLAAVQRHHEPASLASPVVGAVHDTSFSAETNGDVLYGARAIAAYIFGADDNRTRRRVFNLWSHYRDRKEKSGLFKLKGALCLSKSQWRAFCDQ